MRRGHVDAGAGVVAQVQLPVHRLDDDPDFRQLVEPELPDVYIQAYKA
jgi:hypothetical protein